MSGNKRTWIWQTGDWPPLQFDAAAVSGTLASARVELGRLLGKTEAIATTDLPQTERDIWAHDALATAAIEGEVLNLDAVRSSVARRMGIAPDSNTFPSREVEGLLDVMEDAAAKWDTDLTEDRLLAWHAELFPVGRVSLRPIVGGRYRTHGEPMQIVSGPMGREAVHYEAPPSAEVPAQMQAFIDWFNQSRSDRAIDGLVRCVIAHLWFESIHPFEDGNGRIGRALMDLAISQDARTGFRLHGLSRQLQRRQSQYYDALNRTQRAEASPTAWIVWLIDTFREACRASSLLVNESLDRAHFWARHQSKPINERQRKALNRMLEAGPGKFEGGMTPRKLQALTNSAGATATRDLADLVEKGLLVQRGAGRSTRYELAMEGWEWLPDDKRTSP